MKKLIWTNTALEDVERIKQNIEQDSIIYADRYTRNFLNKITLLTGLPELGKPLKIGEKKKELSERWAMIGEDMIQRDLYSSFLIMNVNPDLSSINRVQCLENYSKFKTFHDIEIERLRTSTSRKVASMGI